MKVIDAAKQVLGGDRKFAEDDADAGQEAVDILNLAHDDAKAKADESVKDRMEALDKSEAEMKQEVADAKADSTTLFEAERARVDGVLDAAKPLGLTVEDAKVALSAQKDGTYLTLEQAKDALIAKSGSENGGLQNQDGRRQTPGGGLDGLSQALADDAATRERKQ